MSSLNKSGKDRSGSGRKRQYIRPNDEEGDRAKKRRGSSKVPTSRGANTPRLACLYYKDNPRGYPECAKRSFSRISDVKSHIYKYHIQPEYCTHCGATFKDRQSRDDHIAVTQCPDRPHVEPDGVDSERMYKLRCLSSGLNITEKWFAIFDIVCPDHPRPLSPYHDSEVSEMAISQLREFSTGNSGINIIFERLRKERDWRPEYEAWLREPLSDGFGNLVDQWVTLRTAIPETVVSEHASDEASSSSSPKWNGTSSSEPRPSKFYTTRHSSVSAGRTVSDDPDQPASGAREDASYAFGAPHTSTSLQNDGMSNTMLEDDSNDLSFANYPLPDLDTLNDLSWLDDLDSGGAGDLATHRCG